MKCPEFADLLDYCDGHISVSDAQFVVAHLESGCRRCAQDVSWYKGVGSIAASDDCEDPPAWVLKRAFRLFESHAPTRTVQFGRMLAALAFDSFARPVLSGVRSVETNNRQLLYRAGSYTIDLQIDFSAPSGANLVGQILRENEPRFESVAELSVRVTGEGKVICLTATNAIGEFTIKNLEHTDCELSVETKEGVIVVPRLSIRVDET